MNLSAVDLNLLVAFEALYDTRNVTLAGQRINRAQPSVSSALGRLRDVYKRQSLGYCEFSCCCAVCIERSSMLRSGG